MTAPMPACLPIYRAISTGTATFRAHRIAGLIEVDIAGAHFAIPDLTHGGDLSELPALCAAAADKHEREHARIWGKQPTDRPQLEMEV